MLPSLQQSVVKMKPLVFALFVISLSCCCAEEKGCSLLGGNLQMKANDVFEYPEACLRFRCIEGDQFKITMGCEIRWRGAPSDVYNRELKQLAEDVKKGYACRKAFNIED